MTIILENYPVKYVDTPKVACTSVKLALYEIDQGAPWKDRYDDQGQTAHIHNGWFGAPEEKYRHDAAAHFVFAIVRDPIERFLSAYSNRVLSQEELRLFMEPAIAQQHELVPFPDLDTFVEKFEAYRLSNVSIRFHTDPQAEFLGPDLDSYSRIFSFAELSSLPGALERVTGKSVVLPREQVSVKKFPVSALSQAQLLKLVKFYQDDYNLLEKYYRPPV